jgi:hypothetical protein
MKRHIFCAAIALALSLTASPIAQAEGLCSMLYAPVCALKDGAPKTYTNAGCAKVDGATEVKPGPCEDEPPSQATYCPTNYDPVCALNDGNEQTYPNACRALADKAHITHKGKCGTNG